MTMYVQQVRSLIIVTLVLSLFVIFASAVKAQDFLYLENPVAFMEIETETGGDGAIWHFGTTGGDPLLQADDNIGLVNEANGVVYINGEETNVGEGGEYKVPVYADQRTQTAGFTWTDDDKYVEITGKFRLVRDVLKWEYTISNVSGTSRTIGFRVFENVNVDTVEMDADNGFQARTWTDGRKSPPYFFPGRGFVDQVVQEFLGSQIPDEWLLRFSMPGVHPADYSYRPMIQARQALAVATSSDSSFPVTRPSRLILANADSSASEGTFVDWGWDDIYELQTDPTTDIRLPVGERLEDELEGDSGYGLFYPVSVLGANSRRVIRGEVALNWSAVKTYGQYALAAYAPEQISYSPGDNPGTPTIENGYFNPQTVDIRAYVCNSSEVVNPTVNVSVQPGDGLILAPGQPLTYSYTLVGIQDQLCRRNPTDQYSWQLIPTGTKSGRIPIRVTATYNNRDTITTTTYVNVPALPARTFSAGDHLLGFPFAFQNPDALTALGLGSLVQCAWYDPLTKSYRYATREGVTLQPGRGYWLRLPGQTNVALQGASPINQQQQYQVQINRGWNLVSNPFLFAIDWGLCNIYVGEGQDYTVYQAVQRGLIRAELWAWDPVANAYMPSNSMTTGMQPYTGYWLYSNETVYLNYMPNPFVFDMVPVLASFTTRAESLDDWQVNLIVESGGTRDAINTLGVADDAQSGTSSRSMMEPPMSLAGLSAYFVRDNIGRASGNYAVDLQAPIPSGASRTWTFNVETTRQNAQVTVRWPNLIAVPGRMPMVLIDEATGQQVYMRTAPCYTFNSGNGGVRQFRIVVGGTQQRLQFTQVQAKQTRGSGVTVSYSLNMTADVRMRLMTPSGRIVRTMLSGKAVAGLSTLTWDGRDQQGHLTPRGTYLCELEAEATDGQRVRTMLTVQPR